MKVCDVCGKVQDNNNVMYCTDCGGGLSVVESIDTITCPMCGKVMLKGVSFCTGCGNSLVAPEARESVSYIPVASPAPKRNNSLMIILIILLSLLLISVIVVGAMMYTNSEKDTGSDADNTLSQVQQDPKNEPDSQDDVVLQEDDVKEEEKEQEREQEKEPEIEPYVEPEPPAVSRYELETAVDNYVKSYVCAMNYGDSSYMLDYVIPGCPLYNTQSNFIQNGYYEEYIDSYIIGDIKIEDPNTCVVSVYEIYNVEKPGEALTRTEQTATYRMKKDSDGYWKMYSFVGSVKTHK